MRLAMVILATALPLAASANSVKPSTSRPMFNGKWTECQRYQGSTICSYKMLAQKGSRVCGLWHYWASNSDYDGRLIATAQGGTAKIDKICGRQGSDTQTECQRDKGAPAAWEPANRTLFLCKGALYEAGPGETTSCKDARTDLGTGLGLARTSRELEPMPDPAEMEWLNTCVNGTDASS